jgi:hypothetical protein
MCTIPLPPGVNPTAVNKYIYIYIYMKDKEEKYFGRSFSGLLCKLALIATIYKDLSHTQSIQTDPETHTASNTMYTGGSFTVVKQTRRQPS